jgi:hypothetical protein
MHTVSIGGEASLLTMATVTDVVTGSIHENPYRLAADRHDHGRTRNTGSSGERGAA